MIEKIPIKTFKYLAKHLTRYYSEMFCKGYMLLVLCHVQYFRPFYGISGQNFGSHIHPQPFGQRLEGKNGFSRF
jgi:hypothetical protein